MRKITAFFILLVICFSFVSCIFNPADKDDSVIVQSITYDSGSGTQTIKSAYDFDYVIENSTAYEYENAVNKFASSYYTFGYITVLGTVPSYLNGYDTPEKLKDLVGKTYYCNQGSHYIKITYTALRISYVYVTFLSDGSLQIFYDDPANGFPTEVRVKTENYCITYFSHK